MTLDLSQYTERQKQGIQYFVNAVARLGQEGLDIGEIAYIFIQITKEELNDFGLAINVGYGEKAWEPSGSQAIKAD